MSMAMFGCLPPGPASPDAADRHSETGHIPGAEDVSRHDFAGREDVVERRAVGPDDPRIQLVAASDPRADARERFAAEFNAKRYEDAEALCADIDLYCEAAVALNSAANAASL